MKFGIAFLATVTAMGCGRIAAAGQIDKAVVIKVADQAVVALPLRPHRHARLLTYPAACEAVLFPRSPLCAGRPASYGPYAPYPWNLYWSY